MRIFVKARTGTKEERMEKLRPEDDKGEDMNLIISVKARPVKGAANEAVIKALSKYFGIPLSEIKMISGATSKRKIFIIKG